jgi:hypothetical protein
MMLEFFAGQRNIACCAQETDGKQMVPNEKQGAESQTQTGSTRC